jgi:RHS repeat-associated protein
VTDPLNNVTLTPGDGPAGVLTRAVFDVWGALRAGEEQPWAGFTGEGEAIGPLWLLGYRYYMQAWGRFLSEDPLGMAGGDVDLFRAYDPEGSFSRPDADNLNEVGNCLCVRPLQPSRLGGRHRVAAEVAPAPSAEEDPM